MFHVTTVIRKNRQIDKWANLLFFLFSSLIFSIFHFFLCKFLTRFRGNTLSESSSHPVIQSSSQSSRQMGGKSIKVLHGNNLCRVITGLLAMVATTFSVFFFSFSFLFLTLWGCNTFLCLLRGKQFFTYQHHEHHLWVFARKQKDHRMIIKDEVYKKMRRERKKKRSVVNQADVNFHIDPTPQSMRGPFTHLLIPYPLSLTPHFLHIAWLITLFDNSCNCQSDLICSDSVRSHYIISI